MKAFRAACYGLGLFSLLLILAHFAWPEYEWGQGRDSFFNLGNSLTFASWLASMQLAIVALLCLAGFHREAWARTGSPGRGAWICGAVLALGLSLAEMTRVHERIGLLGLPDRHGIYEVLVLVPMGLSLLALAVAFFHGRVRAEDRPWLLAWAGGWAVSIVLRAVAPALSPELEAAIDVGAGAGFLLGCPALLLALAGVLRPAEQARDLVEPAAETSPSVATRRLLLLGVGGTTFSMIFLQIILFQLLTIFADYMTANTVLSIALLGISVGGLIGYFTASRAPMGTMVGASLLLPLMVLVALGASVTLLETPLVASLVLTLPFVCASVVITVVLCRAESHLVYFIDLLGAAVGAFLVTWALSSFREESSLLLLAAFTVLVAACFVAAHPSSRLRLSLAPVLVVAFIGFAGAGALNLDRDWLNVVRTLMQERYPELDLLFSRSSFVGRYDVIRTSPDSSVLKTIENGRVIDTVRSRTYEQYRIDPRLPHTLMEDPRILIIGLSGDAITKTARWISDDVVGIEINPAVAELQANELREHNGNSYDGIDVVAMDGRTYAEQSTRQFDMITLLNTHFAKGSVTDRAASPEYLQTVEAMRTYLRVLTDRGVVIIEEPIGQPLRETPVWKLLVTMRQALLDEGVAEPGRHFFAFQWKTRRNNYFQILMKKTPFTADELGKLRLWLIECDNLGQIESMAREKRGPITSTSTVLYSPDETHASTVARAILGRLDDDIVRAHNLRPTTDDRPFPFDVDPARAYTKQAYNRVLLLLLLLVPFFAHFLTRHRSALRAAIPYVAVVGLTGMGYLLVEVVLIQRYAIFLGSPVTTFSTVLGSLLIFSGLGSLWSGRIGGRGLSIALAALMGMLLLQLLVVPGLFRLASGLGLGARVGVAVLALAPLAFFMGVPFPFVLRTGKRHFSDASAAMLFAINAATSALAVPLALNVSSAWGLDGVMFVSMIVYLAVAAALAGAHRPGWLLPANGSACALLLALLVSPWLLSQPAQGRVAEPARWELYGLSVGESYFREDRVLHGGSADARVPFDWLFWAARNRDETILIDTSFDSAELAREWGIRDYVRPTRRLAELGVEPAEVTRIVLTHAHWDHAGDLGAYPTAKIYIQRQEFLHMRASLGATRESARGMRLAHLRELERAQAEGRLVLLEGDAEVAPGIVARAGGAHTPGFQHVTVETLDGPVVIAGDATYLYWNNQRHVPVGTSIDPWANLEAIRRMHREAASPFLILPGHDRRVMRWFPEVREGIVRITLEVP